MLTHIYLTTRGWLSYISLSDQQRSFFYVLNRSLMLIINSVKIWQTLSNLLQFHLPVYTEITGFYASSMYQLALYLYILGLFITKYHPFNLHMLVSYTKNLKGITNHQSTYIKKSHIHLKQSSWYGQIAAKISCFDYIVFLCGLGN